MPLHEFKGRLRCKTAIPRHNRPPEVQRGEQGIHQATGPGPVSRAPEHRVGGLAGIGRVKAEPVLAADKSGQVADERSVRDQRALGVACGAAGIDEHRRVIGPGGLGIKAFSQATLGSGPIDHVRIKGPGHPDHVPQGRALRPNRLNRRASGIVHQGQHGRAVLQAELERFRAKQLRQRHGHGPHLQHRHVGHRRFKTLRQNNGDAIPVPHAQQSQGIRQAVGRLGQLGIGVRHRIATRPIIHHRRPGSGLPVSGPASATDLGHVEVFGHFPAK